VNGARERRTLSTLAGASARLAMSCISRSTPPLTRSNGP